MMGIRITSSGLQEIAGKADNPSQVVQHYNNYGNTGAIGPSAVGTVNIHQQWETVLNQVDLTTFAEELGRVIKQQTPNTSDDYQKLALLVEAKEHAEKHEGGKFMETVTKMGEAALPVLAKAGATGLVNYLEHKFGLKL